MPWFSSFLHFTFCLSCENVLGTNKVISPTQLCADSVLGQLLTTGEKDSEVLKMEFSPWDKASSSRAVLALPWKLVHLGGTCPWPEGLLLTPQLGSGAPPQPEAGFLSLTLFPCPFIPPSSEMPAASSWA